MPGFYLHQRFACTAALLLAVSGCAGSQLSDLAFWKSDDTPPVRTRADQLKELRELAKDLPSSEAAKQQQVTLQLSQAIRSESDPIIRAQMLRTIGACSTPGAGQVALAGIQDTNSDVRIAACEVVGRRGGPEAVGALSAVLRSDTDLDVRLAAAKGLGDTRDSSSVEALSAALEDPDPALQLRGVRSLEKVTGKDFGDDVEAWRTFCQGGTPPIREQSVASRLRNLL